MGIFHRRLRDYLGREIIVVMSDGRAFKGILTEFDETAVVLKEVLETATSEIRWKHPLVPVTGSRPSAESDVGLLDFGEAEKSMARLKEVVLHPGGILRVWIYQPEERRAQGVDEIGAKKGS